VTNKPSKFALLLDRYHPVLRAAFLDAIADIRSQVILRLLVERLERSDVQGALDVLNIERAAFGGLEIAIAEVYNAGGIGMAEEMRLHDPEGNRVVFRFGVRNPEAEAWLREHSSRLVTRIVEDQRVGIQLALSEGLMQGQNPRTTALDVVGRINRITGRREGGLIGLTAQQEQFVATARQQLLSGDPAQLRAYLTRERRDKRFDRAVAKAIREGKPLDRETVNRIVGRYADRLLALRGEMLARSETLTALNGARNQAMRQAIAEGKVRAEFVFKTWRATHDGRTRFTHRVLDRQRVQMDEAFVSPSGARLMFPGDPAAPAHEHVGCRCTMEMTIDFSRQLLARRAA